MTKFYIPSKGPDSWKGRSLISYHCDIRASMHINFGGTRKALGRSYASCTCGISTSMHVKSEYFARSLAYCWEEAQGFPKSVVDVFQFSPFELFHSLEFILGSLLRILRPRHTLRPCKYS